MKQHSVPENIMDIEFKLFGSLTVKQFGYVIGGCGLAFFFYYLFKAIESSFLGWIFVGLSVTLGLSLALIRINGQSFEVWLGNFITAMFSSQKMVWRGEDKKSLSSNSPSVQKSSVLPPARSSDVKKPTGRDAAQKVHAPILPQHPFKDISEVQKEQSKVGRKSQQGIEKTTVAAGNVAGQVSSTSAGSSTKKKDIQVQSASGDIQPTVPLRMNQAVPYSDVLPRRKEALQLSKLADSQGGKLENQQGTGQLTQQLKDENIALRQKVAESLEDKRGWEEKFFKVTDMHSQMQKKQVEVLGKLTKVQKEYDALRQKKQNREELIDVAAETQKVPIQTAKTGPLTPQVYDGPSLSKAANVISGIVKTKKDKLLPGVVVVIKDEKASPVRAMKTNSLGQFVTTTALKDGNYTVELSRPESSFKKYNIQLSGEVLPTYEFVAK